MNASLKSLACTLSFDDIKLRDIISIVLCPLLSLDPVSASITKAEDFGESDFQVINLHSGTIRALPAEPFYLNRALRSAGYEPFKPHEFEDD